MRFKEVTPADSNAAGQMTAKNEIKVRSDSQGDARILPKSGRRMTKDIDLTK